MSRSAVHSGGWVYGSAAAVALLGAVAYVALRPGPPAEPAPVVKVSGTANTSVPSTGVAAPAPAPAREAMRPTPLPAPPTQRAAPQPADMPYRFIGMSGSGGGDTIVLFGRGRIVTLRGPGPLDDEYVVDAVFDDYLVIRHVPSGVGKFLPLRQRKPAVGPPQDPEESPRD